MSSVVFIAFTPTRGRDENLNAPGMHFVPLAFSDSCNLPDCSAQAGDSAPNRFYSYGVIARLAHLAAAIELESTASSVTRVRRLRQRRWQLRSRVSGTTVARRLIAWR